MRTLSRSWFRFLALAAALMVAPAAQAGGPDDIRIVPPEWLAEHLKDPDLRVLDVRNDVQAYLAGHVPGAVHVAEAVFQGPFQGMPVQYLPPDMLARLLERAGVGDGTQVVVYSDGDGVVGATKVAYVLEKLGHKAMILNGGWSDWVANGTSAQEYARHQPRALTVNWSKVPDVDLAEVKRLMRKEGVVFVDARAESAFRGEGRTWMRNGHIPGAISLDWHRLMDRANPHRFRPAREVQALVAGKGLDPSMEVVVYCGTSRQATLEYLVLKHVLGFRKVHLYEGSWTEYAAHPELEVETGGERPRMVGLTR